MISFPTFTIAAADLGSFVAVHVGVRAWLLLS